MACLSITANTLKQSFSKSSNLSNNSITENNNTLYSDSFSHLNLDTTREFPKNVKTSLSSGFLAPISSEQNGRPRSNSFNPTGIRKNTMFSKPKFPLSSVEQNVIDFTEETSPYGSKSDFFPALEVPKQATFILPADSSTTFGSSPKVVNPSSSDPFLLRDDTEVPSKPSDEFIPPDGGFGWVVATAACLANIWIVGFIKCYSVLYLEIKERFPDSSAYEASWIPVMLSTIGLLVSPPIGAMCSRYRVRTISSVGGFLCFLGIFLSAFATTLTQMVLTLGVLTGLGSGLVQTPSVLIVNMYFNKRRALASAICVSGNALGGFFIPPLMEYLLQEYKLQGALLIAAALQLHILVSTLLFRPTRDHGVIQGRQRRDEAKKEKLLRSEVTRAARRRARKNSLLNFGELDFTWRTTSKASFEKVQTSLVLSKQDSERDAFTQELSFYRSMPLTGSALNLRLFSEAYAQSACKNVAKSKTNLVQPRSREIPNEEPTIPVTDVEVTSQKFSRKRSQSESTPCGQTSTETVPQDFKPQLPKIQQQVPRKEPMSLHRFAVVNTATKHSKLVEHSNTSLASSDYDGISFSSALSPSRLEENSSNVSDPLINENVRDIELKSCKDTAESDHIVSNDENESDEKENQSVSSQRSSKSNICSTILKSCFDKEVLQSVSMMFTCISSSLFALGAPHSFFYLHAFYTSVDVDSKLVTKILSLSSIVDLSGRLIVGYVADLNVVRLTVLYFLCTGLAGTSVLCIPLVRSVAGITVALSGLGFGLGGFVVLLPTTLARYHGIDKLSTSYSFVRMLHGVMNFISPQVCGFLADQTGSYASVYYFMGTVMTLSAVLQKSKDPNKKKEDRSKAEQENA